MQPRKQLLVDTAFRLFNEHGYHATGIDWILAESRVSKATLYKHFRSKEDLIYAVLKQRDEEVRALIEEHMLAAKKRGKVAALAIFDGLDTWFHSDNFFGCYFINASAEYSGQEDPIHELAAQHKAAVLELIYQYLDVPNASKRQRLANDIALLVEGAIVLAHTCGDKQSAKRAKTMARRLLE